MKQLGELTAADYMTAQVVTVDNTEKLTVAIRLMDDNRLSVLPVVNEDNTVVGLLSTTDLIEITHEIQSDISALRHVGKSTQEFLINLLTEQGDSTTVQDVMTSPVESIAANTNLIVAARQIVERRYRHLPVVNEAGKPIGLLSASDFVRAVADFGGMLAGDSAGAGSSTQP